MENLPITIAIEKDELLYSWIQILYKSNLFKNRKRLLEKCTKGQAIHADGYGYTRGLLLKTMYKDELYDMIMDHTLYPFFAIFYNREKQAKTIALHNYGFDKDSFLTMPEDEVKKIKYCPECIKEDKYPMLKRQHQLPNVEVCTKHKCRLKTIDKKYSYEEMDNIPLWQEADFNVSKEELDYAKFLKDVMEAKFDMDKEALLTMIKMRFIDLNITDIEGVKEYFKERGIELSKYAAEKMLHPPKETTTTFLIKHIKYIFDDIETMKKIYKKCVRQEVLQPFRNLCKEQYHKICSPCKSILLELRCPKCKKHFLTTEFSYRAGLRCPDCQKLDKAELYEKLFNQYSKRRFTLIRKYQSPDTPVIIEHKCKLRFEALPNAFLLQERGCPFCLSRHSLEEAQAKVDKVDSRYRVEEYTTNDKPATFYHKPCGSLIRRRFADFLRKGMVCPVCKNRKSQEKNEEYAEEIERKSNGEYEIIGEFMGYSKPITVRHKECGCVKTYSRASYVLAGKRCPLCKSQYTNEEYNEYLNARMKGRYEIVEINNDNEVTVLDKKTNTKKKVLKITLTQEVSMDDESDIFPGEKDLSIKMRNSKARQWLDKLREKYGTTKTFSIEEVNEGEPINITKRDVNKLVRYKLCSKMLNDRYILLNT